MTPVETRFWSLVAVADDAACWLWLGPTDANGYGKYHQHAHRCAVELAGRSIPAGMSVDHLCRVTSCVNPLHLEVVSVSENSRRRWDHRTGRTSRPPQPVVPRRLAHAAGVDCNSRHCIACWRSGTRPSPVLGVPA
jgi:hypothetical protein